VPHRSMAMSSCSGDCVRPALGRRRRQYWHRRSDINACRSSRRFRTVFSRHDARPSAVPPIPTELRDMRPARGLTRGGGAACSCSWRCYRDPASCHDAKPRDRPACARALEVVEATGRALTDMAAKGPAALVLAPRQFGAVVILSPGTRSTVYQPRIVARYRVRSWRVVPWLGRRALAARPLDPFAGPAMKAPACPALIRSLRGESPLTSLRNLPPDTPTTPKSHSPGFRLSCRV